MRNVTEHDPFGAESLVRELHELGGWDGPWDADDPDANFKADVVMAPTSRAIALGQRGQRPSSTYAPLRHRMSEVP